jgi:hypothetical protein
MDMNDRPALAPRLCDEIAARLEKAVRFVAAAVERERDQTLLVADVVLEMEGDIAFSFSSR